MFRVKDWKYSDFLNERSKIAFTFIFGCRDFESCMEWDLEGDDAVQEEASTPLFHLMTGFYSNSFHFALYPNLLCTWPFPRDGGSCLVL